ncbi:zinc finger, CCHC-type, retrotransposon gag domain protein [Tanacetum coccineum]
MEGKGSGGSKQTPTKNLDAPVTKGELGNEIKRIMSEHLPTILAQSQKNFRKTEEARKATKEAEKKKKANEEAERRRKAIEDKRAVDEQKGKERQNKIGKIQKMLKEIRNEEAERRRRNTEAQGDGCSYKSFLNCKPKEFHRDNDPYASHLLKGEARHWWNMIKIARGDDVASVMTWEEFEDLVMENYCPQGLMDKLEEEFLKLQQNDMTVPIYTAKFNEKARFVKYQVAIKERKIKRYIWGLRAGIRGPVQQARPSTFQEAVELALMVEKENNHQLEEGGDNKRKRENHDDDMKKIKIIGHATKDCKADWVCFRCKKPRHKIVDCPERSQDPQEKTGYSGNRAEYKDTQPLKTMGRVFQLTREMEGKSSGGSKQTPAKNPDAPQEKTLGRQKKPGKLCRRTEKKKKVNEEAEMRRKAMEDKRACRGARGKRKG